MKESRSPVIAIQERVPVKLNHRCRGGKEKHASGYFEVEDQGPQKKKEYQMTKCQQAADGLQTELTCADSNYQHTKHNTTRHSIPFSGTRIIFPYQITDDLLFFSAIASVSVSFELKNNVQREIRALIVWRQSCNHRLEVALKSDNDHLGWKAVKLFMAAAAAAVQAHEGSWKPFSVGGSNVNILYLAARHVIHLKPNHDKLLKFRHIHHIMHIESL